MDNPTLQQTYCLAMLGKKCNRCLLGIHLKLQVIVKHAEIPFRGKLITRKRCFEALYASSRRDSEKWADEASKVADTANEIGTLATLAGVQNTVLRVSDAVSDLVSHHLSAGFKDLKSSTFHTDKADLWFTPVYENTNLSDMIATGTSSRGNCGGGVAGIDKSIPAKYGDFTFGGSVHAGGGSNNSDGVSIKAKDKHTFGGGSLYAGLAQ